MKRSITAMRALVEVIKKRARADKLTHRELAKRLGVSLPTVKRWLRGEGISVESLLRLLELVGMSLQDFASAVPEQEGMSFSYSLEQEKFLAKNPGVLAFFDHLLAGARAAEIQKKNSLSPAVTRRCLSALERIGLIEVLPGDRVKLKVQGEPRWRKNGPLATQFRQSAISEFLGKVGLDDSERLRFGIYRLGRKDQDRLREMMAEVLEFARVAERRGRFAGSGHSVSCGVMMGFSEFEWGVLSRIRG